MDEQKRSTFMKNILACYLVTLCCLVAGSQTGRCASPPDTDPCNLIAPEKVYATFPGLKAMKKQTVGPSTTCNYLDKYNIPALIIFTGKAGATSAQDALSMLGSGYTIQNVSGIGDEAAIAIQQANPQFGLEERIAQLHVKKGKIFLSLSPVRIKASSVNEELEKLKILAAEMLEKL
jgi:hypothetical protein